jgi:hypothetical protein
MLEDIKQVRKCRPVEARANVHPSAANIKIDPADASSIGSRRGLERPGDDNSSQRHRASR